MKQQVEVKITMEVDASLNKKDIEKFLRKLDVGEKPTPQERILFSSFDEIIIREEAQIYGTKVDIEVGDEVRIISKTRIYPRYREMFEELGFLNKETNDYPSGGFYRGIRGVVFNKIEHPSDGVMMFAVNLHGGGQVLVTRRAIILS